MNKIPESHRDILEKKSFAQIATVDAEGKPQVTPVWVAYDGEHVLINSARGRKKDRNLMERPEQLSVSVLDPDNPYRYVGFQGYVAEVTEEGAEDLINELSQKYHNKPYNIPEGQVRVTYKIMPRNVWVGG